jgi:hypothetical protein
VKPGFRPRDPRHGSIPVCYRNRSTGDVRVATVQRAASAIEPDFADRCLPGALQDRVRGSRTDGRSRNSPGEFVPGKLERSFLISALVVWVRTGFNVEGNDLICLFHRVRAEIGKASAHSCLVFFWGSLLAILEGFKVVFRLDRLGGELPLRVK